MLLLIFLILNGTLCAQHSLFRLTKHLDSTNSALPINSSVYYHFDPQIKKNVGSYPVGVAIGDANNDGYNDIVTVSIIDDDVSIYLWNNTLKDWVFEGRRDVGEQPMNVIIRDANNDGYQDIITANSFDNNISILLWNNVTENWNTQITKKVGNYPWSVFVGDTNNDGYNDIVTANAVDNNISILLWNNISYTWDMQITKSVGSEPAGIFIGDANNDGYNDIVTTNNPDDTISILLWNNISGTWNSQIVENTGPGPETVFIADANNDNYNDIITSNFDGDNVSIIVWNNNTSDWNAQILRSVGNSPESVFVGDANNDGYNDIITANFGDNTTSLLLWDKNANDWTSQVILNVGASPSCSVIGDINSDGFNDLVTSNYDESTFSIFLWNPAPKTPVLDFLGPHPAHHSSTNGTVWLNWTAVEMVTKYYIYRDNYSIDNMEDIANLTPIAAVPSTNYTDNININGWYYYVIVAGNAIKNSSISNCEMVHIIIPIDAPSLIYSIDPDGHVYLNWSPVEDATQYSIHRDTKPISLNQSVLWTIVLDFTSFTNYTDTSSLAGTYYYAIVATDGHVYNISNNVEVTISEKIPAFEPIIIIFALILIVLVYTREKDPFHLNI